MFLSFIDLTGPILQNPDKAIDVLTSFVISCNKDKDTKGLIELEVQEKVEDILYIQKQKKENTRRGKQEGRRVKK